MSIFVGNVLLSVFAALSFYTDVRCRRISNRITLSLAVCGLGYNVIDKGWVGVVNSLTGMLVMLLVMLLLYATGALGAGDAKFFAAVGALTGLHFAIDALVYSILYAAVIGLGLIVVNQAFVRRMLAYGQGMFYAVLFRNIRHVQYAVDRSKLIRFPFMYAALPGLLTRMLYVMN